MAAISIHSLSSIAKSSTPLDQIKLPPLAHVTRAIFKEAEAEIIRISPNKIKEPKYLPDLTAAVYLCRDESIEQGGIKLRGLSSLAISSFVVAGIAFYVHLVAVTIFGIVTTATFLAVALPFALFFTVTLATGLGTRPRNNESEALIREIEAFNEYFSKERVDLMREQIMKRIESLKNDLEQQPYKIALAELVSAYGFCC